MYYLSNMKKMLIIGGAGFIGVNVARHFAKNWQVTILDNLSRVGTEHNLAWLKEDLGKKITFVKADVTKDERVLAREVGKHDAVIHLAAQVAVTTSIDDPRDDFLVNALGTFNVLEAIRQSKNKPILLYSSTNKVYGSLPTYPVTEKATRYVFKQPLARRYGVSETAPIDFHSPYGCSKGAADQYVIDYARIYNLKTVVFRQSCIYGEYQFGVEDQGWVAWFVIAAHEGRPITVYGNGKQVRDVLSVTDLAKLYDKAIQKIDTVSGEAFNVGGGVDNTVSVRECLDLIKQKVKIPFKITYSAIRAGDQPIFIADNRKAKKLLGWKPTTKFDEGLDTLISWVHEHQATLSAVKKSIKK
jgi:CDP-paratose 2-epimerase